MQYVLTHRISTEHTLVAMQIGAIREGDDIATLGSIIVEYCEYETLQVESWALFSWKHL